MSSAHSPRVDFEFALGKPSSDVLIGETDGIVASVMVGHDGHRGWVYYVAVDPDCQKLGYGAEMMRAAEMWLKARGVTQNPIAGPRFERRCSGFLQSDQLRGQPRRRAFEMVDIAVRRSGVV